MKLRYLTMLNKVKKTVIKKVTRLKSEGDRDIFCLSHLFFSVTHIAFSLTP